MKLWSEYSMKNLKPAFTLAELLLCIGIIGVVSAMGMTIAKHGTDRAYNLFYYNGYINLYNAIADAKAVNPEANNVEIMNHVSDVLSKEDDVAWANKQFEIANSNLIQNFKTLKATAAPIYLAYGPEYEVHKKDEFDKYKPFHPVDPDNPPEWPLRPDQYDDDSLKYGQLGQVGGGDNGGEGNGDEGNGDEGNDDGVANGWVTPDDANAIRIETNNGSNFYYPSNIEEEGLNGVGGGAAIAGVSNAIPITMTIPQRKTRTNDGVAIVRFAYVDADNGYLIPIADGSTVNLQLRRDLLPAYIDNGIIGRNNVINRNNFEFQRIVYSNYRDAFCTVRNGVGIGNLISCDGYSTVSPREGILKFADPRKAR